MEARGGMTTMRAIVMVLKKIKCIKMKTIESVASFSFITNSENVLYSLIHVPEMVETSVAALLQPGWNACIYSSITCMLLPAM